MKTKIIDMHFNEQKKPVEIALPKYIKLRK